jgi:Na+-transporting methylmalonyl-CoA/oxaloacetate decarboxylase gamma subunit
MKLRSFVFAFCLLAGIVVGIEEVSASSFRVRTVPKESKEQKEQKEQKKKEENKTSSTKQLMTSTASLVTPKSASLSATAKTCSVADPCEKLLAQGGVAK